MSHSIHVLSTSAPAPAYDGSVVWVAERQGGEFRSECSLTGRAREGAWSLRAASDGPGAFAARRQWSAGELAIGGLASLAPNESPGWRSAFAERTARRSPTPSSVSRDVGLAYNASAGHVRTLVAGGRSATGAAMGRVEFRTRFFEAGWVASGSLRAPFVAAQGGLGGIPLRAEWTQGRDVAIRRFGAGGGRTAGGFLLEWRREGETRTWRARGGVRSPPGSALLASADLETTFGANGRAARGETSLALRAVPLRLDARASSRGSTTLRLEAEPAPAVELGATWSDSRIAELELAWKGRHFQGRVQLPERGATRVRASLGPLRLRSGTVRLRADWRTDRPSDVGIEWRRG